MIDLNLKTFSVSLTYATDLMNLMQDAIDCLRMKKVLKLKLLEKLQGKTIWIIPVMPWISPFVASMLRTTALVGKRVSIGKKDTDLSRAFLSDLICLKQCISERIDVKFSWFEPQPFNNNVISTDASSKHGMGGIRWISAHTAVDATALHGSRMIEAWFISWDSWNSNRHLPKIDPSAPGIINMMEMLALIISEIVWKKHCVDSTMILLGDNRSANTWVMKGRCTSYDWCFALMPVLSDRVVSLRRVLTCYIDSASNAAADAVSRRFKPLCPWVPRKNIRGALRELAGAWAHRNQKPWCVSIFSESPERHLLKETFSKSSFEECREVAIELASFWIFAGTAEGSRLRAYSTVNRFIAFLEQMGGLRPALQIEYLSTRDADIMLWLAVGAINWQASTIMKYAYSCHNTLSIGVALSPNFQSLLKSMALGVAKCRLTNFRSPTEVSLEVVDVLKLVIRLINATEFLNLQTITDIMLLVITSLGGFRRAEITPDSKVTNSPPTVESILIATQNEPLHLLKIEDLKPLAIPNVFKSFLNKGCKIIALRLENDKTARSRKLGKQGRLVIIGEGAHLLSPTLWFQLYARKATSLGGRLNRGQFFQTRSRSSAWKPIEPTGWYKRLADTATSLAIPIPNKLSPHCARRGLATLAARYEDIPTQFVEKHLGHTLKKLNMVPSPSNRAAYTMPRIRDMHQLTRSFAEKAYNELSLEGIPISIRDVQF